ncbi:MAG: hypothetical protein J7K87_03480 [Candidatus Aenigmarchaeota archaeon]|nr:hypothetical protein [Candidatus Aenigmarchaeota archaeon]
MIITDMKPFGILKAELKKDDRISIVSCNECARLCGTGGKEGLEEMKKLLMDNGYNVVDTFLLAPVCDKDLDKRVVKPHGNVILVLACDSGYHNIKILFKDKKVIPALDTIGLGAFDEKGDIFLIREFK